jgi:hypothetical protein
MRKEERSLFLVLRERLFQKHILLLIPLLLFLLFIFKLHYDRISSFSFGDEYNSFIMGYFMQKGRVLYSQIFTNHQVLIAYFSYAILKLFHPVTLYKLVFYHRMLVIVFSLCFDTILFLRFRFKALGILLFFEFLKYYFFGNLFLAESFVVYPILYLFFLSWLKIKHETISKFDIIVSGVFAWFVIFLREPFVPLALLLFGIILAGKKLSQIKIISFGLFLLLSLLTLFSVPLKDFYDEVIRFNFLTGIPVQAQTGNSGIISLFFYPVTLFFGGKWNFFRYVTLGLDSIFLLLFFMQILQKKHKECLFIFLILALAAIRHVPPGTLFFEAFHMIVWYGLFLGSIFLLLQDISFSQYKKIYFFILCSLFLIFLFQLTPQSYIWEKVNKNEVFTINYARHYTNGEAIRRLASPHDTLFADTWDYLLFWQADLDSSYKYGVYTFIMTGTPKYRQAKEKMFQTNPPTFYYTYSPDAACEKDIEHNRIAQYVRIYSNDKYTCLYMQKKKVATVSKNQWDSLHAIDFSLEKI